MVGPLDAYHILILGFKYMQMATNSAYVNVQTTVYVLDISLGVNGIYHTMLGY